MVAQLAFRPSLEVSEAPACLAFSEHSSREGPSVQAPAWGRLGVHTSGLTDLYIALAFSREFKCERRRGGGERGRGGAGAVHVTY